MKLLSLIFLFLFSLGLGVTACDASWIIFHKPEFKGQIVDFETNEPIESAVVVAIYRTHALAVGDSVDRGIDAREAITDKNGKFTIPPYSTIINPVSWSIPVEFIIFKPGYVCDGAFQLEEEFSGAGTRPDRDYHASWNPELKYRILKSGILMLRKVSGNDRIQSYYHTGSEISLFKKYLPIAHEMKIIEADTVIGLERQWRYKK